MDTGELSEDKGRSSAPGLDAPHDEALRGIAMRRLSQITAALGLASADFEQARRQAQAAIDGPGDTVVSAQLRAATQALVDISDPSVRARAVALLVALADDDQA